MVQSFNFLHLVLASVLLSCASLVLASTPVSFCKCTCFSNSTIIPLDPASSESASNIDRLLYFSHRSIGGSDVDAGDWRRDQKHHALSCNNCNRKFCLDYDLPTCKNAKEENVLTTCFQRDSKKDEAVVFIFIFSTSSLLVWAALKPWVEKWIEAAREKRAYIPVSEGPNI